MIAQAEQVADGGEDGVGMVVMRFGDGRADGGAGVVEKLVLESHGHVGDGLTVGVVISEDTVGLPVTPYIIRGLKRRD